MLPPNEPLLPEILLPASDGSLEPLIERVTETGQRLVKRPDGRFAPGTTAGPGRPKGSLDRFRTRLTNEAMDYIEKHGREANPFVICAKIAMDESRPGGDHRIAVRAASVLLAAIVPKRVEVSGRDGGPVIFDERERNVTELARDPMIRAIIETAEERLGQTNGASTSTDP